MEQCTECGAKYVNAPYATAKVQLRMHKALVHSDEPAFDDFPSTAPTTYCRADSRRPVALALVDIDSAESGILT